MILKRFIDIVNESNGATIGDKFTEVVDYGDKKIFTRNFGKVGLHDKDDNEYDVNLIVIAEIYDLRTSGAIPENEIPEEGDVQLSITLLPEEKYISKELVNKATQDAGNKDSVLLDVYDYAGGLNYSPNKEYIFKTMEDAEAYLMSAKLNEQITAQGMLSGYTMDKHFNRAGDTNWKRLEELMFGK